MIGFGLKRILDHFFRLDLPPSCVSLVYIILEGWAVLLIDLIALVVAKDHLLHSKGHLQVKLISYQHPRGLVGLPIILNYRNETRIILNIELFLHLPIGDAKELVLLHVEVHLHANRLPKTHLATHNDSLLFLLLFLLRLVPLRGPLAIRLPTLLHAEKPNG